MQLGVVTKSSDIDCVCVVPRHITREHFFRDLVKRLKQYSEKYRISDIVSAEHAYTPIISMRIEGQAIDLSFARLDVDALDFTAAETNLLDDSVLIGLEEESVRSLNGYRTNAAILACVPGENKLVFRTALRFVKHWAKCRGLSSNKLGFFGGITWAILVAKVCQLYPNHNAAGIVHRFFVFCDRKRQNWGPQAPALLSPIREATAIPP
ncbi:unnamed protein product, partial [Amoebophrya sp. A120]|eukprot:GSA120T00012916001.1